MAVKVLKAERLNAAIVKKVEDVLNNTQHIRDIKILIEGSIGMAPSIKYEISEFIDSIEGDENEQQDEK